MEHSEKTKAAPPNSESDIGKMPPDAWITSSYFSNRMTAATPTRGASRYPKCFPQIPSNGIAMKIEKCGHEIKILDWVVALLPGTK